MAPRYLPFYCAQTTINVRDCGAFLVSGESIDNHQTKEFFGFIEQITMMANGTGRLWDDNCVQMLPLRKYVQENWLKIAINSQLAERWVKDSNI